MTALLVWLVCLVCAALWYVLTASAAALTAAAALVFTGWKLHDLGADE